MSIEVKIPAVGESISSGVVSVWHKKSGDFVNPGDALFTLETEKVSTEIVAENAGVLEAKAAEGQEVKIGEVVAIIDDSKAPEEILPVGKNQRPGRKRKSLHRRKRKPLRLRSANQQRRMFFRRPFGALLKKNISNRQKSQEPEKMAA